MQSSLERDLAEITSPDYPGERLVVCRNPLLAEERRRKRLALLDATEKKLAPIQARVKRAKKPLRGKDKIALAVGAVLNRYKMAKHFVLTITDDDFSFERASAQIDAEAALDGLYVIRTSLTTHQLDAPATVAAYKSLAHVERAFRCMKTIDLHVRRSYTILIVIAAAYMLITTHPKFVLVAMAYAYLASPFVGMAITRLRQRGNPDAVSEHHVEGHEPALQDAENH